MDKVILHWSYRDLRELPVEMQDYRCGLAEIYLKENFITSLPRWLFGFTDLRFINLTGNLIVHLPDEIVLLVNLEVLVLSKNCLQVLPQVIHCMKALKELQVNDNQLTVLPEEVGQLSSLELLDCSNNLLTNIPKSIEACTRLKELIADGNQRLQELPVGLFRLPQLNYISANQCDIRSLPTTIETESLQFVRVFHNLGLAHIPLAFETFVLESNNLWNVDFKVPISYCHCIYRVPGSIILPRQIRKLKTARDNVLSLYELALRNAYKLNAPIYDLPEYLKVDLVEGPVGQCGNTDCDTNLFNECFLLLMNRRKNYCGILFSQIFCSQHCIQKWSLAHKMQYSTANWPKLECMESEPMDTL